MRQVPHYLIIGNGFVARHFQYYFSLLNISFSTWHREQSTAALQEKNSSATHVLILIRDDAIEKFIDQHLKNINALCLHFSGSLVTDKAIGAHPLMCFNENLYPLEQYQKIAFVIDDDAPAFEKLFPQLSNPHARLKKTLKAKYHALCVLSGNFSCLLWQKLFSSLEEFNIPAEFAFPYLQQQTKNLLDDYRSALTGPLVRKDHKTIENNLSALITDPIKKIYASFVSYFQERTPS